MIVSLRRKIAGMTMTALVSTLVIVVLFVYGAAMKACDRTVYTVLQELSQGITEEAEFVEFGNDFLPQAITVKVEQILAQVNTQLHAVVLDNNGNIMTTDTILGNEPMDADALEMILETAEGPGEGRWKESRYYWDDRPAGDCILIIEDGNYFHRVMRSFLTQKMLIVAPPLLILLWGLSWLFSGFAVRPAKEALKKQQRFLADAGHELKTPLASITINAAALEEDVGSSRYLDCIRYESTRMSGLVRRMVDLACMEEPEKILFTEVDLSSLLEQSSLSYESAALERNIRYEFHIEENVCVQSDPERIRQIAAILLDNAFKYADEGGTVAVSLQVVGGRTTMEIGNSGQGIPKEECPYIFERFYRVDKARSENGSYGLGLSIAGSLAREVHGRITVESDPGVWTVFRLLL